MPPPIMSLSYAHCQAGNLYTGHDSDILRYSLVGGVQRKGKQAPSVTFNNGQAVVRRAMWRMFVNLVAQDDDLRDAFDRLQGYYATDARVDDLCEAKNYTTTNCKSWILFNVRVAVGVAVQMY